MRYLLRAAEMFPNVTDEEERIEAARIAAWHATFNAAVTGLAGHRHYTSTVIEARAVANETHGKID